MQAWRPEVPGRYYHSGRDFLDILAMVIYPVWACPIRTGPAALPEATTSAAAACPPRTREAYGYDRWPVTSSSTTARSR